MITVVINVTLARTRSGDSRDVDIETLRGSIASATGQGSGAAGTASDEAEQHINSANTRLTGQRTAQNFQNR